MFTESNTEPATVITDIIRKFLSILDIPAYALLGLVYELFFNVASADLFSNDTIMKFYGRVQIILGVFMMFHLAMTILKGIVTPDNFFKDSGEGSGPNLIVRIVTALILLTVLMPISIPGAKNEYERQINNNGILFGTLYSLQYRILSNNTLGRLILGTNDGDSTFVATDEGEDSELKKASRVFTSTILKGFYRINLIPEEERDMSYVAEGKDAATINDNRVCTDIDDDALAAYTRIDANPGDIISMVNLTCDSQAKPGFLNSMWTGFQKLTGTSKYVFTYTPLLSFIVPVIFVFILLSFTIDVAVRAVKLAVLRLIAPIPIISYMDPKGSKDGAFSAWVKTLTSTYLDLFIRLAAVYFVIFLIQDMMVNGLVMDAGSGILKVFTYIAIWIGLFAFAKQAPKFIKEVLGLKGDVGKLFSGFESAGTVFGMAAAIPGAIGSGIASARASEMADKTRKSFGKKDIFGREINPDSDFNKGKHLLAGIAGAFAGGAAGIGAAYTAKDHGFKASMEAMRKRNQDALARGNDGSTLLGRLGSSTSNVFMGEGRADAISREIESNKGRIEALKAVKSRVTSEMIKQDWTRGDLGIAADKSGNKIGNVNFKSFEAKLSEARARGDGNMTFDDIDGHTHTISLADAERQRGFLLKNNEDDYVQQHVKGTVVSSGGTVDGRLITLIHSAEVLGGSSKFTRDADGNLEKGDNQKITDRSSINDAIDFFEDYNTQLSRNNAINKANDRFSGKKTGG